MPYKKKTAAPKNGVGYGGDANADKQERLSGRKQAAQKESQRTAQQQTELNEWKRRLHTEEPSEDVLKMLRDIFRNQTPAEWGKKRRLYTTAIECCQSVGRSHPNLLGDGEDDESLLSALEEFADHAEMILKHGQSNGNTDKKMVQRIVDLRSFARSASSKARIQPEMSVMDPREFYRQALRPLRFEVVEKLDLHTFANQAKPVKLNTRRLFRELTTYKSALPIEYGSSIFVRAVESRLDLLRVLITGPEDTPYSNGCYVFDVWLDNYPAQPPKVKYLTTGGGKYRFNPNLYNDGKVCLSLLGTWSGPGWSSGESTLLQVLVSIQSLILVSEPYFNEPGFQSSQGTPQGTKESDKYNKNIRKFSLEVCILPFLSYPSPFPEFDEAIKKHFHSKKPDVRKTLYKWYLEDNTLQSQYAKCLDLLETERKKARPIRAMYNTMRNNQIEGVIEIDSDDDDIETIEPPPAKRTKSTGLDEMKPPDSSPQDVVDLT